MKLNSVKRRDRTHQHTTGGLLYLDHSSDR